MKVYELISILMGQPAGADISVTQNNPSEGENAMCGDVTYADTSLSTEDECNLIQLYFNTEE